MSTGPGDQALQPQTSGALLSSVGPVQVSEGPTATAQQSHSEQPFSVGCTVTCCLNRLRSTSLQYAVQQIVVTNQCSCAWQLVKHKGVTKLPANRSVYTSVLSLSGLCVHLHKDRSTDSLMYQL